MKLISYITAAVKNIFDYYETKRTGVSIQHREFKFWYRANVNYRADNIPDMFSKFKYVFIVDIQKFMDPFDPFDWVPNQDAKQYFWPSRELGNNAVWRYERVIWDDSKDCWILNEFGGTDTVFVATNSKEDAVMISLKYS